MKIDRRSKENTRGKLLARLLSIYKKEGKITLAVLRKYQRKGLCASYSTYWLEFGGIKKAILFLEEEYNIKLKEKNPQEELFKKR